VTTSSMLGMVLMVSTTEDGLPGKGTGRHIAAFILPMDRHFMC
jgi:hypothetical protein